MAHEDYHAEIHTLPIHIWVGKAGLTDTVIDEIVKQLKKRSLVKIKLLQSATQDTDRKIAAAVIAERANAIMVRQVGNIVIIRRKQGGAGGTDDAT